VPERIPGSFNKEDIITNSEFLLELKNKHNLLVVLILFVLAGCYSSATSSPQTNILNPTSTNLPILPKKTVGLPSVLLLSPDPPGAELARGKIRGFQDTFGGYFLSRPIPISDPLQTLVVIHGTPAKDLSAGQTACYLSYIMNTGTIVII